MWAFVLVYGGCTRNARTFGTISPRDFIGLRLVTSSNSEKAAGAGKLNNNSLCVTSIFDRCLHAECLGSSSNPACSASLAGRGPAGPEGSCRDAHSRDSDISQQCWRAPRRRRLSFCLAGLAANEMKLSFHTRSSEPTTLAPATC